MTGLTAGDERPHDPEGGAESWRFVADAAGSEPGLEVEVGLRPGDAWFAATVHRAGVVVAVVDPSVPRPRTPFLELRSPGLWADHVLEEAGRRWSLGLEAFGVAVPDADVDLFDPDLRGERLAVGWDLEWESEGPPVWERAGAPTGVGYALACSVRGEVLLGDLRLELDTVGRRSHHWGL
ncbi:MAG: hypothetical protein MUE36_09015 [Acidimicrobiales bacterium]|nr:hypothetical protein [Acidimicrobiales bacterium]